MSIQMQLLAGNIGREVAGVDLARPLGENATQTIRQALFEHCVLVFRGQDLPPEAQIRFTALFGAAQPHPLNTRPTVPGHPEVLILQNRPGKRGARNDYWHSDISHAACPPSASILHAREVPQGRGDTSILHAREVPQGRGDTLICNMYAAWDQLSQGMREMLSRMRAEHSAEPTMRRAAAERTDAQLITEVPPPRLHPVARTHPDTGRTALFVNPHFTMRFEDMSGEESAPLLDFLLRHATRPENIYRHRWQVGDVLMWDNRCTMHYAVRDYDEDMPRLMHRTTAAGEAPC